MIRVIDCLIYDTSKAKKIHYWQNDENGSEYREAWLYQTVNNRCFLVDNKGKVIPLSDFDAVKWLEEHRGSRAIIKHFPDYVEEA